MYEFSESNAQLILSNLGSFTPELVFNSEGLVEHYKLNGEIGSVVEDLEINMTLGESGLPVDAIQNFFIRLNGFIITFKGFPVLFNPKTRTFFTNMIDEDVKITLGLTDDPSAVLEKLLKNNELRNDKTAEEGYIFKIMIFILETFFKTLLNSNENLNQILKKSKEKING